MPRLQSRAFGIFRQHGVVLASTLQKRLKFNSSLLEFTVVYDSRLKACQLLYCYTFQFIRKEIVLILCCTHRVNVRGYSFDHPDLFDSLPQFLAFVPLISIINAQLASFIIIIIIIRRSLDHDAIIKH